MNLKVLAAVQLMVVSCSQTEWETKVPTTLTELVSAPYLRSGANSFLSDCEDEFGRQIQTIRVEIGGG
jgi:hypothetical protein